MFSLPPIRTAKPTLLREGQLPIHECGWTQSILERVDGKTIRDLLVSLVEKYPIRSLLLETARQNQTART